MIFVFFFDLAPVLFCLLLLFCALMDQVAVMLPIICTLFWILFAIYVALNIFLLCIDDHHGVAEKLIIGIIMVISIVLTGIISQGFFAELSDEYGYGGINGLFGFIVTLFFGGCTWLLALCGLSYASYGPLFAETSGKFVWNLIQSVGILLLVNYFLI